MRKTVLTENRIEFIRKNRLKMTGADIAGKLGISSAVVTAYLRKNGLQIPRDIALKLKAEKCKKPFTPEEDAYICKNIATSSIKKIAMRLHRSPGFISKRAKELGLEHILRQKAKDSFFKKGHITFNKGLKQTDFLSEEAINKIAVTRFKKGNQPSNTRFDGATSIRVDSKGIPYVYLRVKVKEWVLLHKYNWEKEYGPYDVKTHCLRCKDGDTTNCAPDNWELITRAENLDRNDPKCYTGELREIKILSNQLNKIINDTRRKRH